MTVNQLKDLLNNIPEECGEYSVYFYDSLWMDENSKCEISKPINETTIRLDERNKRMLLAEIFDKPKPKEFYKGIPITKVKH